MRIIYMGKNKQSVLEGLEFLLDQGADIAAVVAPDEPGLSGLDLARIARGKGLFVASDRELYAAISSGGAACVQGIELVISFLYWKRIRGPLIALPKFGCVNFHPAPLPEYRGWAYTFGILNGESNWGVSAHHVDEEFDTGDLIEVRRFPIDPATITCFELEQMGQRHLLELLKQVYRKIDADGVLPRRPQGPGRYYSKEQMEARRRILPSDPPDLVDRKIRAFWYPPYGGAVAEINGRWMTVCNDRIVQEAARWYHAARERTNS